MTVKIKILAQKEQIDKKHIPEHIAIIMDGNGRWAAKHGSERILGHEQGVKAVRKVIEGAIELGIKYITLYAFSTENWTRPPDEVNAIMELFVQAIENETDDLNENNIKLLAIGDIEKIPSRVKKKLDRCIDKLHSNNGLNLILAISYSSKWEITEAVKKISSDVKKGNLKIENINTKLIDNYLTTREVPDPDLLIRTSGEYRISNFLLWQIAYSELLFVDKLWPDFQKEDLYEAVIEYQKRERRFGKTSQQLKGQQN